VWPVNSLTLTMLHRVERQKRGNFQLIEANLRRGEGWGDGPRVLPKAELVLGEAVRREQLFLVLAPEERADLRARVHRVEECPVGAVPELDATVGRTPASGQQVALERAPCQGLDSRLLLLNQTRSIFLSAN
jgi:hypothetical protein